MLSGMLVMTHAAGDPAAKRWMEALSFGATMPGMGVTIISGSPLGYDDWAKGETCKLTKKFAHKTFALAEALGIAKSDGVKGWLCLVDADVEWTAPIDLSFLDPTAAVAYLGRPWYKYTEGGFRAYNLATEEAVNCILREKDLYEARAPETRKWGHESLIFDRARVEVVPPELWQDLTGHLDPNTVEQKGLHVWPSSPLGKFSIHHKGPKRKRKAYAD